MIKSQKYAKVLSSLPDRLDDSSFMYLTILKNSLDAYGTGHLNTLRIQTAAY